MESLCACGTLADINSVILCFGADSLRSSRMPFSVVGGGKAGVGVGEPGTAGWLVGGLSLIHI